MRLRVFLWLFAVALGIHCASFSRAQEASTVQLAYKFVPGATARYRITQELSGVRVFPGSKHNSPIAAKLTTTIRIHCTKVLQDGNIELAIDTESGTLEMAGRSRNYKPSQAVRKLVITPAGNVITSGGSNDRKGDEPRLSPLEFSSLDLTVIFATLSPERISPGGSWYTEIPMPLDPSTKLRANYKLERVSAEEGGQVAYIKQTLSTAEGQKTESGDRTVRGSQRGEVELRFSLDSGVLISASGTVVTSLATTPDAPSVPGVEMAGQLSEMKVESKFQITKIETTRESDAR